MTSDETATKHMKARRNRTAFILAFLSPAVLLYGLFVVWPLAQAFYLSLFRWRGVSAKKTFIGADNYIALTQDDAFHIALKNNMWLLFVGGSCLLVLGVLLAHGMQSNSRGVRFLRGLYLFPQVISLVVVAIIWQFLLNPSYGLASKGLEKVGIHGYGQPLATSSQALTAVGIAFVWYAVGFYVMLFSAGLKQIPEEIGEAAQLDGSAGWHRFWKVTWPLLWSVKRISTIYIVINVLNIFALVWVMTEGGPNRATETLLTLLYRTAFKESAFGYGTSVAVANFAIAMILAAILMFIYRRSPEERRA
ncbi:MAG: sugar ABC transporter permease [Fimbriimonadaceae bacterium]|nr:sugar ABC transporter permease [Fimbriimonadaceae bacterium]